MHILFAAMRLFPFWAIPAAMILWELMIYYRRKSHKNQYFCAAALVFLLVSTVAWFIGRGDLYADQWTRTALGSKR